MNHLKAVATLFLVTLAITAAAVGQTSGDFRTHQTGNWDSLVTWERYNGATWISPAPLLPDTLHATSILAGDTVFVTAAAKRYVGVSTIAAGGNITVVGVGDTTVNLTIANGTMTVNGTLKQTGGPAASPGPYALTVRGTGALVVAAGGTFHQDQNGGQIPAATWADGSTLLVTGVTSATNMGSQGLQSYSTIVWNCPNQTANANFGFNPTASRDTTNTIRGDILVLNTGAARCQFSGPPVGTAEAHSTAHITVNGNIRVLDGSVLTATGTSSAYTDIFITVLGNISVQDSVFVTGAGVWRWSQLSISRGSQSGLGTATWYLKGDSIVYGRKTTNQNSSDANTGATTRGRFIFCKPGLQTVILDDSVAWSGECNMQFGDSVAATTVRIGNSPFGGSACTQRIKHNATVIVGADGYIGGGTNSNSIPSNFAIEEGGTLQIASPNGIRATGMGSSGAVRVSGNRDYGTAANFVYNGAVLQDLGSGFPASANNLTIDNASGVTIDSVAAFTINGTLAVTSGDLEAENCVITLGPAGVLSETPGNTVVGTVTTTRTVSTGIDATFGGIGMTVNAAGSAPGVTTVTRVTGTAVYGGTNPSILRTFDVAPAVNSGLNATLDYFYDDSELNGQDASALGLYRSTDAGGSWETVASTVSTGLHRLRATGVDAFSLWAAADSAHSLIGNPSAYIVNGNWNMVSLPREVTDPRTTTIFPSATSNLFGYTDAYQIEDSLVPGVGYWLKFAAKETLNITGFPITEDSIQLVTGWNMIGTITDSVPVSSIIQLPPGCVVSAYYGYTSSYLAAATLLPSKGYWVKGGAGGGTIVLAAGGASAKPAPLPDDYSSMTISDGRGAGQTLYFSSAEINLSRYDLPPLPPAGAFDARFATGRLAASVVAGSECPIAVQTGSSTVTVSWDIKSSGRYVLLAGDGHRSLVLAGTGTGKLPAAGRLILKSEEALPTTFALVANYPNPFNPSTEVTFDVASAGPVSLKVYDVLGRDVATLVNEVKGAGRYTARWDASDAPSGVYILRMAAPSFNASRKMLLVK